MNCEECASELEAKVLRAEWRRDYNEQRPHSALGDLTPAQFALRTPAQINRRIEPNPSLLLDERIGAGHALKILNDFIREANVPMVYGERLDL